MQHLYRLRCLTLCRCWTGSRRVTFLCETHRSNLPRSMAGVNGTSRNASRPNGASPKKAGLAFALERVMSSLVETIRLCAREPLLSRIVAEQTTRYGSVRFLVIVRPNALLSSSSHHRTMRPRNGQRTKHQTSPDPSFQSDHLRSLWADPVLCNPAKWLFIGFYSFPCF